MERSEEQELSKIADSVIEFSSQLKACIKKSKLNHLDVKKIWRM